MKRVLVVDDDIMMLRLAERILSPQYDVTTVNSGREALASFADNQPDLILSDLIMPEMSGFDMQRILRDTFGSEVPVMFMTADGSDDAEGVGFDMGASDFIRKPFHPEALLRRVENIFNNQDRIRSLKVEASIDKLTGLLNKASIEELCASMCRTRAGMLAILDLDSFKLINDIYGHEKGDIILRKFSAVLRGMLTKQDAAGRLGGDEFLAFLCGIRSAEELESMTRELNTRFIEIADEVLGKETGIPFGVSAGAVLVPDSGRDFLELFRLADKAMYSVKQNGKHASAFYSDLRLNTEGRRDLRSVCRLFEERTVLDGAYRVGADAFVQVYHYFSRYIQSYGHTAYRLLFTLTADRSNENSMEDIAEAFCDITAHTLRKSDILVQLSEDQFFLILPDINEAPLEKLVERIITGWQGSELSEGVSVQYEAEPIPTVNSLRTSRTGDK